MTVKSTQRKTTMGKRHKHKHKQWRQNTMEQAVSKAKVRVGGSGTWTISSAPSKVYGGTTKIPVVLSREVERKIITMLDEFSEWEWMGGLVGELRSDHYYITDMLIPDQKAGKATIEATDAIGVPEMAGWNLIGWIHSHNSMSAFQSSCDHKTAGMYDISITVNNKQEYFGTLRVNVMDGEVHMPIEVRSEEFALNPEWLATVKDKVHTVTYAPPAQHYHGGPWATHQNYNYDSMSGNRNIEWNDRETMNEDEFYRGGATQPPLKGKNMPEGTTCVECNKDFHPSASVEICPNCGGALHYYHEDKHLEKCRVVPELPAQSVDKDPSLLN
jgi:proteasome lid subunit RPN8/RPN11